MPIINKGTSFSNGEQLTADKINNLLDLATFNQSATDSASTTVNSASQIVVADSGVTTAKLATDAVETAKIKDANVTFAKLADVIDDDTMATATATNLATSESIKAYVDSSANITATSNDDYVSNDITASGSADLGGLILKFGRFALASDDAVTLTFPTAFPTACFYVHCIDTRGSGLTAGPGLSVPVTAIGASSFTVNRYNEMDGTAGLSFFAIGQ